MEENIDDWAYYGYIYAESNGMHRIMIDETEEMQVMAFNAGISNYNVSGGFNFPPLIVSKRVTRKSDLDKNPYPADFMSVQLNYDT